MDVPARSTALRRRLVSGLSDTQCPGDRKIEGLGALEIVLAPSMKAPQAMSPATADTLVRLVLPPPMSTELAFRHEARATALGRLVSVRIYFAPVIALLALTLAFFEPTLWRRVLLATVVTMVLAVTYVEWIRFRRSGIGAVSLPFNLFIGVAGQLLLISATGGLFSPLLPAVIVLSLMSSIMAEERLQTRMVAGLLMPGLWVLAVVHRRWGLIPEVVGETGELETGWVPWVAAAVYSLMVVGTARIGLSIHGALERLFFDALQERDRRLSMHEEQTKALSALSAEIAHELKNPLASVKGLAALVARDVEGKSEERVAVLRREVDRMQSILDELLNFSRPLVPLSMEPVDARALADDVVRMHEGSAVDRDVALRVESEPTELMCDPRKVRQVLVNLVQNALQASPRGGAVVMRIAADVQHVVFEVDDEGPGVAADVRDRVFEAGVTTKEEGSGIGLVVARSLARQHGGELELSDRPAGGCRAVLRLPRRPLEGAAA